MSTLYDRIVWACGERNITPGFMCDELGFRRGMMSELKKGDYNFVSCGKLAAMADFLKVSCDFLLRGYENDGITEEERGLISAFRTAPLDTRENIKFMLRNYMPVKAESEDVKLA